MHLERRVRRIKQCQQLSHLTLSLVNLYHFLHELCPSFNHDDCELVVPLQSNFLLFALPLQMGNPLFMALLVGPCFMPIYKLIHLGLVSFNQLLQLPLHPPFHQGYPVVRLLIKVLNINLSHVQLCSQDNNWCRPFGSFLLCSLLLPLGHPYQARTIPMQCSTPIRADQRGRGAMRWPWCLRYGHG